MTTATFRGVPFHISESDASGGRAVVRSEVPWTEKAPWAEDLGLAPREWSLRGHVSGPDVATQRDALLSALEREGPGELVHPYVGTRTVVVGSYRVGTSASAVGVVNFDMVFLETSTPSVDVSTPRPETVVAAAGVRARAAAVGAFLARYNPQGYIDSSSETLASIARQTSEVMRQVQLPTADTALLHARAKSLEGQASGLATTPVVMAAQIQALVGTLRDAIISLEPAGATRRILALQDVDLGDAPTGASPARQAERDSVAALKTLYRTEVVISAAEVAVHEVFATYPDAVAARDAIVDAIDTATDDADDAAYVALDDMRAAVMANIPGPDESLPRVSTYAVGYPLPSLVLAHRLYADRDRAEELVTRNSVSDPMAVSGTVEVLSRG